MLYVAELQMTDMWPENRQFNITILVLRRPRPNIRQFILITSFSTITHCLTRVKKLDSDIPDSQQAGAMEEDICIRTPKFGFPTAHKHGTLHFIQLYITKRTV